MMAVHKLDRSKGLDLILHTRAEELHRHNLLLIIFIKCSGQVKIPRRTFAPSFPKLLCPQEL